jgi:hypothetical protein
VSARVAVCGWLWRQNAAGGSSASARTSAKLGTSLVGLMKDPNADVRRSAVKAVKRFAKQCPGMGGRVVEVRACRQCIASFHTQGHRWPPRPVPCLCPCVFLGLLLSTLTMVFSRSPPPTVCSPTGVGCPRQQRARQTRVRARPHARAAGPHQPRCPGGEWVAGPCGRPPCTLLSLTAPHACPHHPSTPALNAPPSSLSPRPPVCRMLPPV